MFLSTVAPGAVNSPSRLTGNLAKWSWKLHLEFLMYISNSDMKQRSETSCENLETILKLTCVFFPCTCPCHHFHEKLQRGEICWVASGCFCFPQISAERRKFHDILQQLCCGLTLDKICIVKTWHPFNSWDGIWIKLATPYMMLNWNLN